MIVRRTQAVTRTGRLLALGIATAVAASVLTAFSSSLGSTDPASARPRWSAGQIITDSLFFDYTAMSRKGIQHFLDKWMRHCKSVSEASCLKDVRVDTRRVARIPGRCDHTIPARRDQSAASIIRMVAHACEVSPRVLLVTLQKEQGLVTANSVTRLTYRKTMGYGCPDSARCNAKYYGFFNQVYWAARAYNAYGNFPESFRFQAGRTLDIAYSPKDDCASKKNVRIRNRATAALYNYTPYTPNKASLANPYGTGNRCSSYGNRNFWLFFNQWFGTTSRGHNFSGGG
jgi:hypothetical protein